MTTRQVSTAPVRVVRTAALDMQHSQRHSGFVVGPTTLPPVEVLAERLAAMAAVGPAARIGLEPSAATTRWRHRGPSVGGTVVAVDRPEDPLELLTGMPTGSEGIRIVVAGEYLAIRFSHGLGDVALLQTVVDVLLGGIDPNDDANWRRYRGRWSPLLAAGVRTFGSDPRRLTRLAAFHHRRPRPLAPPAPLGAVPTPSPAAVAVHIPAAEVAAMRARRDESLPGVGMFAIQTVALTAALRDAGIPVDPMVTVPFDVRGYLPRRIDTLASFSAGLEFPVDESTDPASLQASMRDAAQMGRPVANLLVGTAKIRLASAGKRFAAGEAAWREPVGKAAARLLHSSVGRVPRTGHLKWTDRSRAGVLVSSDPVGPVGITVTSATVLDGLWFTAAFHDSVFAADRVAAALDSVGARIAATLAA